MSFFTKSVDEPSTLSFFGGGSAKKSDFSELPKSMMSFLDNFQAKSFVSESIIVADQSLESCDDDSKTSDDVDMGDRETVEKNEVFGEVLDMRGGSNTNVKS